MTVELSDGLDLTTVSDEEFNDYVNADIRGTADADVSAALREPDVLTRWYECLLTNKASVESQLAHNKAERADQFARTYYRGDEGKQEWASYLADQTKWRSGAIRFKNGTDVKLVEAKRRLREVQEVSETSVLIRERNEAISRANTLRQAIIGHRETVDDEEEAADERLWAAAEQQ